MDQSTNSRVEQVTHWLEENVQVVPEPKFVTLSAFSVNWTDFSGEFSVSFDSSALSEKLKFGLEASGKTCFQMPMFHSPLGVPASYAAIEITDQTHKAILKGLRETFPRLRGAGLDRKTGKSIACYTPSSERIEAHLLEQARNKVSMDYSITVELEDV